MSTAPKAASAFIGWAGAMRKKPARYLLIAMTSALAWVFARTGFGYALGDVTNQALMSFGSVAPPFLIDALLAVGVWR